MSPKILFAALAIVPVSLLAFSTGPPAKRTGAAVDGGITCTACHNTFAPANSDPRGSIVISAINYTPGTKQTIHVTVAHPDAVRWGFQLTARLKSDETKEAGTFATSDLVRVRCDTTPASDTPCNGTLEFAEHKDAPRTDAGAGFTFDVEWTPPATNVGDVVFYAAGNAANGNGSPTGDRIYTTSKTISAGCAFTQKPTIRAVGNGASFTPAWSGNEMMTIFGSGFQTPGQTRSATSSDFVNNAFPKALACVAVEIAGKRVPIAYVQGDQINLQAPTITAVGPFPLQVIVNPDLPNQIASDMMTVTAVNLAPAFFTFNGRSIAAQFAGKADIVATPAVVAGANPAKPGDVVTLYGTGFGFTDPTFQAGEIASGVARLTTPFTVTIGGTTLAAADVLYGGLSPNSISGLYQFNVRIPATVADGDVPVVIQMGAAKTQDGATIPIKH